MGVSVSYHFYLIELIELIEGLIDLAWNKFDGIQWNRSPQNFVRLQTIRAARLTRVPIGKVDFDLLAGIPSTFAISALHTILPVQPLLANTVVKMVYNWEGKRDTCFNMYITENKGLEEIQAFYREQGFNPR